MGTGTFAKNDMTDAFNEVDYRPAASFGAHRKFMADIPKDFFTLASMLTLSGATGATFVICNGLQRAFNFNPRWLGLAVAVGVVLSGVYASGGRSTVDYLIGIINSFLVYCSAAGATGTLGGGSGDGPISRGANLAPTRGVANTGRRRFLSLWY